MKKDIHPKYFTDAKATCVCGAVFAVGSTVQELTPEICSSCHPYYTKQEKILDTAGRIDRFNNRKSAASKKSK